MYIRTKRLTLESVTHTCPTGIQNAGASLKNHVANFLHKLISDVVYGGFCCNMMVSIFCATNGFVGYMSG